MYLNTDFKLNPLEHFHLVEYWIFSFLSYSLERPSIRCVLSLVEVKAAGSFITSSFVRLTLRERCRADLARGVIPEPC